MVEFEVEPMSIDHAALKFNDDYNCKIGATDKPQYVSVYLRSFMAQFPISFTTNLKFNSSTGNSLESIPDQSRFKQSVIFLILGGMEGITNNVGITMGYLFEQW